MVRTSLGEALDRHARMLDREVVRFGDETWSWREWERRIRLNAAGQIAEGVRPGDRVAFLDKNHPACLETTMACALAGTTHAILNFRLAPEELIYLLNDSQARLLFVGAEFTDVVQRLRAECSGLRRVIVVGGPEDEYESWLERQHALPGRNDQQPCFLQLYTSGTTGFPKGTMLTHEGMVSLFEDVAVTFDIDSDSAMQVAMPLYHVGGTSWALLAIWVGGRVVIHRDVDFDEVLDVIEHCGITHTFLVPAVLHALVGQPGVEARDLSRLKVLSYGASPIPAPLLRECLKTFPNTGFVGIYGMTETSGTLTALSAEAHRNHEGHHRLLSVGQAVPGVELAVVDPATGARLNSEEVGEVRVRTAHAMSGYWRQPEATAETLRSDGWLRTGDAGRLDADGYLYITDRVKDMIISGGENVYPAEIERVLVEHPAVGEVAVIGIPSEKWGEVPKAFVVPADGLAPNEASLIEYCRARLAGYKCPSSVELIDALPRNPTGKVLKRDLRAVTAESGSSH